MQVDKYIQMYLVNDIVLAITLVITGYAWYVLMSDQVIPEEEANGDVIAEVVIPAEPVSKDNES